MIKVKEKVRKRERRVNSYLSEFRSPLNFSSLKLLIVRRRLLIIKNTHTYIHTNSFPYTLPSF